MNRTKSIAQKDSTGDFELPDLKLVNGQSNQVVVESFDQLKAALALPEESINIFFGEGAEIRIVEQLRVIDKKVELTGHEEEHASFEVEVWDQPALWIKRGSLTLRNIEIRSELDEENDDDNEEEISPVISCHVGKLKVQSSRIYNLSHSPHCIELVHSSGEFVNSQLFTLSTIIDWIPALTTTLTTTESIFLSPIIIHVDDTDEIKLNFRNSTFIGEELFGFDHRGDGSVSFSSNHNLYVATSSFIYVMDGELEEQSKMLSRLQLNMNNDILPLVLCSITDEQDNKTKQQTFEDSSWSG